MKNGVQHRWKSALGVNDRARRGFTLVELLVVVTIILLVSAVTLPTIVGALGNRQIGEAARTLQAAISGARDAAIRANAPRGIRLLPDVNPGFHVSPFTDGDGFHPGVLTYNRMIPIEPGPEYSQGQAKIVSDTLRFNDMTGTYNYYVAPYPNDPANTGPTYPDKGLKAGGITTIHGKVLRLEECAYQTGGAPNNPTSWWWNIRVGDKVRLDDSGQFYTVVGPIIINPSNPSYLGQNPELFVNMGLPSDVRANSPLQTNYGSGLTGVEFLYLVNGYDDDGDGFTDEGWDGIDNDVLNGIDDAYYNSTVNKYGEWEDEAWLGALSRYTSATTASPPLHYSITRRPVPSPSARESALPGTTVIDATTWNSSHERSRLPVDAFSGFVDILVNQSGEVVPTSPYSTPASFNISGSFYHFWIADRQDVIDPGLGSTFPSLPMLEGTLDPNGANPFSKSGVFLKKDRALLTLFTRSGLLVTNSIETFDVTDSDYPYRGAQLGTREVK